MKSLYRSEMIGDNKSFSNSSAASSSIGQRNNNHVYDPTKARKSVLKMLGKYRITSFKLKIIRKNFYCLQSFRNGKVSLRLVHTLLK
jgi:hypothetical protein